MNILSRKHINEIEKCLNQWGSVLNRSKCDKGELMFQHGIVPPLHLRFVDDWLQIKTDLGIADGNAQIWSALTWNGLLDGAAKFSLNPQDRTLRLRAEIPLEGETDIATDLFLTLTGIERAVSLLHGKDSQDAHLRPIAVSTTKLHDAEMTLQELLAETGWTFVERSEGNFVIDLEHKGNFYQALIEHTPEGFRRVSVVLTDWDTYTPESRAALAVMLLSASDVIRMVRPVAEQRNDRIVARFEVHIASRANSALLGRGLSALSVACRYCAREANILNIERIAERYLAIRGIVNE